MIRIDQGGEYRGETYIFCTAHETTGPNNGQGWGSIFEGDSLEDLMAFLTEHRHGN
jgi:hypothetical protein